MQHGKGDAMNSSDISNAGGRANEGKSSSSNFDIQFPPLNGKAVEQSQVKAWATVVNIDRASGAALDFVGPIEED